MRFRGSALFVLCACAVALPASAANQCRQSPKLVGACFVVRGRLFVSNGTPDLRMWKVGTHRILGIVDPIGETDADPQLPPHFPTFGIDSRVYGNFAVCPLTKERRGAMQTVCIAGWDALHIVGENPN
jgi:hypothetical protein